MVYMIHIQKRHVSVADRSFVMGTIGEIGDAMGTAVAEFVPTFYPIVHGGIKDEDEEVIASRELIEASCLFVTSTKSSGSYKV